MRNRFVILLIPFVFIFLIMLYFYSTNDSIYLVDVEGNKYNTVEINGDVWMTENFRATRTSDSVLIDGVFVYENRMANVEEYGCLYRWTTAMKVCPKGWHMPTRNEWIRLVDYYGGIEKAGESLKSKQTWLAPNTGVKGNSLFNAVASGFEYDGKFMDMGLHGDYWGMVDENHSFSICLYNDNTEVKYMQDNDKNNPIAFAVRYVKNK